jgi:hypothetical protein
VAEGRRPRLPGKVPAEPSRGTKGSQSHFRTRVRCMEQSDYGPEQAAAVGSDYMPCDRERGRYPKKRVNAQIRNARTANTMMTIAVYLMAA